MSRRLQAMLDGKPHVYKRDGAWWVYIPSVGYMDADRRGPVKLMGNSISDHRRAAGWMK